MKQGQKDHFVICSLKRSIFHQTFASMKIVLWNFVNITVGKLGYSYLSLLSNYFNLLEMKILGKEFSFCKYPTPSFNTFTWGDRYCCKFMQHKQGFISFLTAIKRRIVFFKRVVKSEWDVHCPCSLCPKLNPFWFSSAPISLAMQCTSVMCL